MLRFTGFDGGVSIADGWRGVAGARDHPRIGKMVVRERIDILKRLGLQIGGHTALEHREHEVDRGAGTVAVSGRQRDGCGIDAVPGDTIWCPAVIKEGRIDATRAVAGRHAGSSDLVHIGHVGLEHRLISRNHRMISRRHHHLKVAIRPERQGVVSAHTPSCDQLARKGGRRDRALQHSVFQAK